MSAGAAAYLTEKQQAKIRVATEALAVARRMKNQDKASSSSGEASRVKDGGAAEAETSSTSTEAVRSSGAGNDAMSDKLKVLQKGSGVAKDDAGNSKVAPSRPPNGEGESKTILSVSPDASELKHEASGKTASTGTEEVKAQKQSLTSAGETTLPSKSEQELNTNTKQQPSGAKSDDAQPRGAVTSEKSSGSKDSEKSIITAENVGDQASAKIKNSEKTLKLEGLIEKAKNIRSTSAVLESSSRVLTKKKAIEETNKESGDSIQGKVRL